jgi:hypothetical protein
MKRDLQERLGELEAGHALAAPSVSAEASELFCAASFEPGSGEFPTRVHVARLQSQTVAILRRAESVGRADLVLKCIREARSNLELLARITGQFDLPSATRITAVVVMPAPATTESLRESVEIEVTRSCPHL